LSGATTHLIAGGGDLVRRDQSPHGCRQCPAHRNSIRVTNATGRRRVGWSHVFACNSRRGPGGDVSSGTNSELGVGSNLESGTRPVGSAVVALSGPLVAMSRGLVTMNAAGVGVRRAGSRDEVSQCDRCGGRRDRSGVRCHRYVDGVRPNEPGGRGDDLVVVARQVTRRVRSHSPGCKFSSPRRKVVSAARR
jgi:hypothetical protein